MSLPVVIVDRRGVARLRGGHPWIYIDHLVGSGPSAPGLVVLEGPPGRWRGIAVWNPRSRIPVRIVDLDPAAAADWQQDRDDFWRARVDHAIAQRSASLAVGEGACRWVFAEADGLPGLIVDRYGDVAVVQAGCAWADSIVRPLAAHLIERHGLQGVLARHDGGFRKPEGLSEGVEVLAGTVPERIELVLAGLPRLIDVRAGQKTGTYLDQRSNQLFAADVLKTGRRLDAFCNDGGFALQLLRAGPGPVVAVDSSESALARLTENARLAELDAQLDARRANVFEHLRELEAGGEVFDGIVLDPPALAKRKAELDSALRGYRELNLRALRLLRTGGRLLTCSCSAQVDESLFLAVLAEAAADAHREVRVVERRGAAACHPVRLGFPESAYLKVALLEVMRAW